MSGKEGAKDKPSWVDEAPFEDESGKDFAERMLEKHYGKGHPKTKPHGPTSEHNQIRKWADRNFE